MATDSLTTADARGARHRTRPAGPREVARWAATAAMVALVLLAIVALTAGHDHGQAADGLGSGLLATHHDAGDMWWIFRRNLLVLGIHLCACWIGAIVGHRHRPTPARWGRAAAALNRPVPGWMGRAALAYALVVTLLSVAVQAIALGRELADLSAATRLSCPHLLWLVAPHALPELVAVFLPLGLFLREAGRGNLQRLGPWSLQAAAIALPVLLCAAAIETYVSPGRVIAARQVALGQSVSVDLR
jgi:hypothetical protein